MNTILTLRAIALAFAITTTIATMGKMYYKQDISSIQLLVTGFWWSLFWMLGQL